MREYKIWDKKSDVGKNPPKAIFEVYGLSFENEVILVYEDGEFTNEIIYLDEQNNFLNSENVKSVVQILTELDRQKELEEVTEVIEKEPTNQNVKDLVLTQLQAQAEIYEEQAGVNLVLMGALAEIYEMVAGGRN